MIQVRHMHAVTATVLSAAMLVSVGLGTFAQAPVAEAVTVSEYQQKVSSHDALKAKLAGVNDDLANLILQLDDLTEQQIPAAQEAANQAQSQAQQAQDLADATNARLDAAKKDKADLEAKIKQTGEDYDDARAAVAQLARDSFHGSDASDVMDVVTNATTTKDFVNKMQSEAAVTRSEANAASDAAVSLNTSMNRQQRLDAIEQEITKLKQQYDGQLAQAQQALAAAQSKQSELQTLRDQGSAARAQLEAQKSQLTTQEAREAADIVAMKSEIDSWNQNVGNAGNANAGNGGQQQIGGGSNSGGSNSGGSAGGSSGNAGGGSTGGNTGGGTANGMDYAVPGSCPEGSSFCYGHNTGNTVGGAAYPARQCTLWAYIRRSQMGLPVGSYMGNGAEWANSARRLGYLVNRTPHVGAVMVFARGQKVTSWYADWQYGHVAIVERVNADGSVLVSEGGTGFASFPAYETIYNTGNYEYIHY